MNRPIIILRDSKELIETSQYTKAFKVLNKAFLDYRNVFAEESDLKVQVQLCRRMAYVCSKLTDKC
jgi:hypothetical protein